MTDNVYFWLGVIGLVCLIIGVVLTVLIVRSFLSPVVKGLLLVLVWVALAAAGYFGYMYGYPYIKNRFFPDPVVEAPPVAPPATPTEVPENPEERRNGIIALQEFCDDFSENGTYENLDRALKAHKLYAGRLKHGEESEVCKISYTEEGAAVVTEADLSATGNYALVTFLLGEEVKVESIQLHTDTQIKIPEDSRRAPSLLGRGYADTEMDTPDYQDVVGYLVPSAYQMARIERNESFEDETVWEVPTLMEDEEDIEKMVESDSVPHKTMVVCRDQNLTHLGYGLYTGTLLVETLDEEDEAEEFYVNAKNFVTKPYWVYKTDIRNAVAVGDVVAAYHQVSAYPPRSENGDILIDTGMIPTPTPAQEKDSSTEEDEEEDEDDWDEDWEEDDDNWDLEEEDSSYLEEGDLVLVTGVGGLSGVAENDVEAYYWNDYGERIRCFFNSEDLEIVY